MKKEAKSSASPVQPKSAPRVESAHGHGPSRSQGSSLRKLPSVSHSPINKLISPISQSVAQTAEELPSGMPPVPLFLVYPFLLVLTVLQTVSSISTVGSVSNPASSPYKSSPLTFESTTKPAMPVFNIASTSGSGKGGTSMSTKPIYGCTKTESSSLDSKELIGSNSLRKPFNGDNGEGSSGSDTEYERDEEAAEDSSDIDDSDNSSTNSGMQRNDNYCGRS